MAEIPSDKDLLALETERLLAAARDSLSDEIVARLAATATDTMDLIDRVNRAGLSKAIPAIEAMVISGDLDRLATLARLYGCAQDALTDDMVNRLAETAAEGLLLLDRLHRSGAGRLIEMLARMEASGGLKRIAEMLPRLPRLLERLEMLDAVLHAFEGAGATTAQEPKSSGGVGGLWSLMCEPDSQDALRYLVNVGNAVRSAAIPR